MMQRSDFLDRINSNIALHGYHVTVVTGGQLPRFAYTIGCKNTLEAEFIFAGGEYYSQVQIGEIIRTILSFASREPNWHNLLIPLGPLGDFSIIEADTSWSGQLLLGAFDYYNQSTIPVWQILPDQAHRTLDIPDMSQVFEVALQPVWRWLAREWDYDVPRDSMAVTDLKVLFGKKATEIMRWDQNEWEIFSGSGSDIPKQEWRMVPLGVLIGVDEELERAVHLPIGKGLWRDILELEWNSWG